MGVNPGVAPAVLGWRHHAEDDSCFHAAAVELVLDLEASLSVGACDRARVAQQLVALIAQLRYRSSGRGGDDDVFVQLLEPLERRRIRLLLQRGALDAGAPTIGFNITLPHEQEPNPYSTPDLTFQFHYFAMRKMHLAMRANALVVFPGGFGTFDELFEILTLRQTQKIPHRLPIVLYDPTFWHDVIGWKKLVEAGVIAEADLDLFAFADSAEAIWDALIRLGLSLPFAEKTLEDRVADISEAPAK